MNSAPNWAAMGMIIVVIVVFALAMAILQIICLWKIVSKAGYHGAMSLLWLVPLVNIIMMVVFAFSEWPVQKEVKILKSQSGRIPSQPVQ